MEERIPEQDTVHGAVQADGSDDWLRVCLEDATRFTNVLRHVLHETPTSYTQTSSTRSVAHLLLSARDESEFPQRLHHVFNELIGRPGSTFHLKLRNATPEELGRYALSTYQEADSSVRFTSGASRTGLSMLTLKFLQGTKYIDTVLALISHGLQAFFDAVVATGFSPPASHPSPPVQEGETPANLRVLMGMPPRESEETIRASAPDGLCYEVAWALAHVARYYLVSANPKMRSMPQPILPVSYSAQYAREIRDAYERLGLPRPAWFDDVGVLLEEERLAPHDLGRKDRVLRGRRILDQVYLLTRRGFLLHADMTAWRALAYERFGSAVSVPEDSVLFREMRQELVDCRAKAESPLKEHYAVRIALVDLNYRELVRICARLRLLYPREYPVHFHFFGLWSMWADAVEEAERSDGDPSSWAAAEERWIALWDSFSPFCETELPVHERFLTCASAFSDRFPEHGERISALMEEARFWFSPFDEGGRAAACQLAWRQGQRAFAGPP